MAKSVAEVIGDIEVEKITGPSDAQALKIGSFWQDQVIFRAIIRLILLLYLEEDVEMWSRRQAGVQFL